ncbi:hypothetical protein AC230_11490 [Streptomyces caatingaensis]|uniref:Uncharacterized protein n=2 Tax=Streptomyces caatingaensis TaxID=1678637 RepID=A0A0K9XG43_9ACTN|nr:hypothetical protein AC230_11490 [Streptomyces caatingaensis]
MACRFPGADGPDAFWRNLADGVESVTRFPPEPVPGARADGATATYTPARGLLDRPEWFDAGFFGCSPREARLLSPQHRLFLECAAEALEDAGQDPARPTDVFGVYGGGTTTDYARILHERRAELPSVTDLDILLGTAPDYLVSRTAYKLGLTGPAVTVQTACSTALVAVHLAVQGLLAGDCDVALAGAAAVHVPDKKSQFTHGGILSARGQCRAFDASADGTVGGDGVGIVVLKRLADAEADGDHVLAVLRGTAVNNDGGARVGYTAPGTDGQAAVVREAQLVAGVDAGTIGYVEAHGTATPLGDPIELTALTRAFRQDTDRTGFCWIGSVKTNIGHTDAAAGAAGLIKAVLALRHRRIPPSLHFTEPNPQFDFAASPFRVATRLVPWEAPDGPRRAAVSAFGIGGTNAHAVLEEAPPRPPSPRPAAPEQLLVLSAASPRALDAAVHRLADRLASAAPDTELADVAWTLQTGRREHPYRAVAVARGAADAVRVLTGPAGGRPAVPAAPAVEGRPTAFLFSGAPGRRPDPARCAAEPAYRQAVEECCAAAGLSAADRDAVLHGRPAAGSGPVAVAAFAREYATAMTWIRWGVRPDAVLCSGPGTPAAMAVAKVLPLADALRLALGHARAGETAGDDPAAWAALVARTALRPPRVPVFSPASGRRLTAEEAADPGQWARAAARPDPALVRRALAELLADPHRVLLEVSPDRALLAAARTLPQEPAAGHLLLPEGDGDGEDDGGQGHAAALAVLGRLWAGGAAVRWKHVHGGERRSLTPLPTYPFQRERFLVEPAAPAAPAATEPTGPAEEAPHARKDVLTTLLRLYAELLGLPDVGPDDDFFDLGGDSLVAARLAERVRELYPVDIDGLTVYEAGAPAELAAAVEELMAV